MRVDVPVTLAPVVAVVVGVEGTPPPPREQPDGQGYDDDPNGNFGGLLNGLGAPRRPPGSSLPTIPVTPR